MVTKSEPPPPPPPKSSRPPKEGSKKRKRLEPPRPAKRSRRASKSNTVEEEAAAAAVSASPAAEEASSAVSSPRRWPYIPRVVEGVDSSGQEIFQPDFETDPLIISAYEELKDRYCAKEARDLKLPTLDPWVPSSCFEDDERLLPVRASATKTILQISKVVLSLSSYLGDSLLARSSGFVIDWDANSESCTILTSALLILSKSPSPDEWAARDEYAPHAKVYVHLLNDDDSDEEAKLLFYDKHYNIALFRTTADLSGQIPPFSSEVNCAQEVFVLGRDESRYLSIDHGYVDSRGPCYYQRHHYMYASCNAEKAAIGGAVINTDGEILGMISSLQMGFIPSSIILKCLRMWKKFDCIPRLHAGMKLSTIIFLDPIHIEKISRKCGLDDGLIVTEVSEGSVAEKLGIKAGDIIKRWNREKISTTVEV